MVGLLIPRWRRPLLLHHARPRTERKSMPILTVSLVEHRWAGEEPHHQDGMGSGAPSLDELDSSELGASNDVGDPNLDAYRSCRFLLLHNTCNRLAASCACLATTGDGVSISDVLSARGENSPDMLSFQATLCRHILCNVSAACQCSFAT